MADTEAQLCTMLDLPEDVWGNVSKTLANSEDGSKHLAALRCVCSRIRTAVDASVTHLQTRSGVDGPELGAFLLRSPGQCCTHPMF